MGFYGNLMHKYKKNEITILKGTICSAIIYFLTIYRFLILIKKSKISQNFFNFITIFIRIYQKMMILPRIPKVILKKI
jgi:hypothetical protein